MKCKKSKYINGQQPTGLSVKQLTKIPGHNMKCKKSKYINGQQPTGLSVKQLTKIPVSVKNKRRKKFHVQALKCRTSSSLVRNKSRTLGASRLANGKMKRAKNTKKRSAINFAEHSESLDLSEHLEPSPDGDDCMLGLKLFTSLIKPYTAKSFFEEVWEKEPMLFNKMPNNVFENLLTSKMIEIALKDCHFLYGENVDVTKYIDGKRHTLNVPGRASATHLWEDYSNGCSIRFLNPQAFFGPVASLCSSLQEVFGTFVGANVYLTPPDSQGFAPHYDDIEAFIFQLEGEKEWKLYRPRSPDEELPMFSSPDFSQEELDEPIMTITLKPGNVLYFPRGMIHQANTVPGKHSLHITLSCYQNNTWGHLLEKILITSLQRVILSDVEMRQGLPVNYLDHVGLAHSTALSDDRSAFMRITRNMAMKVLTSLPIDQAADEMAKGFMADALPPVLTPREKMCSALNTKLNLGEPDGANKQVLGDNVKIRLTRKNILRLVSEEGECRLYTCADNTFVYHELEPSSVVIPDCAIELVEQLIFDFPNYTNVADMSIDDVEEKMKWVNYLWDRGMVLTAHPLGGS